MKSYWAYTETNISGKTFIFDTLEDAQKHAYENGEYEGLFKDQWMEKDNQLYFEVYLMEKAA